MMGDMKDLDGTGNLHGDPHDIMVVVAIEPITRKERKLIRNGMRTEIATRHGVIVRSKAPVDVVLACIEKAKRT